jgi:adenylate cyclase
MKRHFPTALALVVTGLVLALALEGLDWTSDRFLTSLDRRWMDSKFRIRGELEPLGNIVIVAIDEKTLDAIGSARTFARHNAAELVNQLARARPRVIAFDVFFEEPDSSDPDNDGLFADAIRNAGNVVMAVSIDLEPTSGPARPAEELPDRYRQMMIEKQVYPAIRSTNPETAGAFIRGQDVIDDLPVAPLAEAAATFGFVNFSTDAEGFLRQQPQFIEWGGRLYPSLDLQILRIYLGAGSVVVTMREDGSGIRDVQVGDYTIPTDRLGQYMLNFNGPDDTFTFVSWIDVQRGEIPPEVFRDKIVIVGPKAVGLGDAVPTPFDPLLPGVELHANVIDNVVSRRFVRRDAAMVSIDLLSIAGLGLLMALYFSRLGARQIIAFTVLAFGILTFANVWTFVEYGWILSYVYPALALVASGGLIISYKYIYEEREKKHTRRVFSHYLDQAVIERVVDSPERLGLGGEKTDMTVLFSDIRGFSAFSEQMSPQELVAFLNAYFDRMTGVIFESQGTLDKLIGDAVMCFWGHPIPAKDHALRATTAALRMMRAVREFRTEMALPGGRTLDIGIGLSSGDMVVGNMGARKRFSYTVIGDEVNLASRLEGLNKFYGTNILISGETFERVRHRVFCREVDRVGVKGRDHAVTIYEPIGFLPVAVDQRSGNDRRSGSGAGTRARSVVARVRHGERRSGYDRRLESPDLVIDPDWDEIRPAYERGLACYRAADFDAADEAFDRVLALSPADGPSAIMKRRIAGARKLSTGPGGTFDPVYRFEEK